MQLPVPLLSRRRFLLGAAGSAVLLALSLASKSRLRAWYRSNLLQKHRDLPAGFELPETAVLTTVAEFAAALHGHQLDRDSLTDITDRLGYACLQDGGWVEEYRTVSHYLDDAARSAGAKSFVDSSATTRDQIVDRIMRHGVWSLRDKVLAQVSQSERTRRLIRISSVRHLSHLYRNSFAPWRHRGYARAPGLPNGNRMYTTVPVSFRNERTKP